MARFGEIRKGENVGKTRGQKFIWHACVYCKQLRWVLYHPVTKKPNRDICHSCANIIRSRNRMGSRSSQWKGGRLTNVAGGYIAVKVFPEDKFFPMADKNGYVLEHRLVMAHVVDRCLARSEIIHHKNGVKTDNRIEDLEITSLGKHAIEHGKGYEAGFDRGYSDGIDTRIKELEARVKLLETILYSKAREGEGRWEKRLS